MSRVIGFILAAILFLFIFGGSISDEDLEVMDVRAQKRQEEEAERLRKKEDEERWERQQQRWQDSKNNNS